MDPEQRELLRQAMDIQYRHKVYNDPNFLYLRSMGCYDMFQAFGNSEIGFIGYLHLKWVRDDYWETIWYDTMEEGDEVKQRVANDHPIDPHKLMPILVSAARGKFKEKWTQLSDNIILN